MKLNNNLIFSIWFTIIFITYIFWNRFFRIRLPKELTAESSINFYVIFIFFTSLFFTIIFLINLLYFIEFFPRPESKIIRYISNYLQKRKWYHKLTHFIDKHILNGPSHVFKEIIYPFVYIKPFLDNCGAKLSYYFLDNPQTPYILGFVLPRLIPWIILCYETIILKHINYFYKSLFLLVIPLFFNILIYMIEHHCKSSLDFYTNLFDFTITEDRVDVFFKKSSNKEFIKKQDSYAQKAGSDYEFYQYLYNITYQINFYKNKYKFFINSIVYFFISIATLAHLLILINIF